MYLRCLTGDRPRQWLQWLPWAEYIFNTAYQSSLLDTPFRIVYGRDPPSLRSYEPGETRVAAVARTMEERAEFLADVRHRLEQAQAVQKNTTTRATVLLCTGQVIGCCFASVIGLLPPSHLRAPAS
jgi:hypothetical protein